MDNNLKSISIETYFVLVLSSVTEPSYFLAAPALGKKNGAAHAPTNSL
jgi:hypothetical protein